MSTEFDNPKQAAARASRLNFLLEKSTIYAKIIGDRMERQQIEKQKAEQRAEVRKANKEKRSKEGTESRTGLREKKEKEVTEEPGAKRKRGQDAEKDTKKAKVEVSKSVAELTSADPRARSER
jgi:ATP-dependent DNA helicase